MMNLFSMSLASMGVLASLTPHIFLLDLAERVRQDALVHRLMEEQGEEGFGFLRRTSSDAARGSVETDVKPSVYGMEGRFQFIDFTRGVVIAVMAWDHVAGFWSRHKGGKMLIGRAGFLEVCAWFMSRFVTHYCAPTFIFIAGAVYDATFRCHPYEGTPLDAIIGYSYESD